MLYVNNFFVNKKEAVSNQIELLRKKTDSKLLAAGIFMEQKQLDPVDLKEGKIILPEWSYNAILPFVTKFAKHGIHYFEEEPSLSRRLYFNYSPSNLYISMYRRPTPEYVEHVKKYQKLRKLFVELPRHKEILVDGGIDEEKIVITHTPGLFEPLPNQKHYNQSNINIVFASWNDGTKQALEERGILFLIEILKQNPHASLTIPLRDGNTKLLESIARVKGLSERLTLFVPKNREELHKMYMECDYVAFTSKKRVTKDVPNSIIDGILCGKPSIVSTTIDYSHVVREKDFGIIISDFNAVPDLSAISNEQYYIWSHNAHLQALHHTEEAYSRIIQYYEPSDVPNL